ncbi:MAG: hypothetical protein IAG10_24120, partial [Planctomycetaceae bacterium]|nr:hypothetical protein [Planctomycetaceae bacterium]
ALTLTPSEGHAYSIAPSQGASLLAYQTESLMRVWAIVTMLPEGQSPDSLPFNQSAGAPRFKTIEPPAKPTLAPFEGAYDQGRVELVALRSHPPSDQPSWKPNGEPLTEAGVPELGGSSSARGKVMKEFVVRVHSETGLSSSPVLRFPEKSSFSGVGSSYDRPNGKPPILIQAIACPPEARQMTVEVGVADGEWRNSLTFERHGNQLQHGASSSGRDGAWRGSVRTTRITGETVPLAFSYSWRNDYETRLVYERADGTIIPLKGDGSDGGHEVINAITTLPIQEFESIRRFHVQSRRYQWVEFRNVSLELGHRTTVEVQNPGVSLPPLVATGDRAPSEKPAAQLTPSQPPTTPSVASPSDKVDPEKNKAEKDQLEKDRQAIILKLHANESFVKGFRVKTETKIRQRVGNNFQLPEIEREIKTMFAVDERGRIRSEETGGVPGNIGTTDVRQRREVAVFDGLLVRWMDGNMNEELSRGYLGRDKGRIPREVDPRNYLHQHGNEPIWGSISGGRYRVFRKETWQDREVILFESAITTYEADKVSYRGLMRLDPALGYAAVFRVSQIRFDDLGPDWHDYARYELSDYKPSADGIWLPGRAVYTSLLPNRDVVKAKQPVETAWQHHIRFIEWELNPTFTDDDFTLKFPDGIFVMDETK